MGQNRCKRQCSHLAWTTLLFTLTLVCAHAGEMPLERSRMVNTRETTPVLDSEANRLELGSIPMPFADWALVEAGQNEWVGPDGKTLPLDGPHGLTSPDEARAIPLGFAHGVAIRAQEATKAGVFSDMVPVEHPWERANMKARTLLYDEAAHVYRVWYECPGGLAYAESADLKTWRKPLTNPTAFGDRTHSNLAYIANRDECAASGMFQKPDALEVAQSGTVFVDPSAPPDERFKTTTLASATPEKLHAFAKEKGKPLSSRVSDMSANVLFPAVSADGVAWRVIPEPNLLHDADTQTVVFFDTRIRRYVAYTRLWEFGRRAIGRAESKDFRDFPLPRAVLSPDANEAPYIDYYANAMARYPGRDDLHLMFVLAYDRRTENSVVRAATSRDGALWRFAPGGPVLRPGTAKDWDSHFVLPVPSFVRAPDGDLLLLYSAYNQPHKFPRAGFVEGNQGVARWKADRLSAIEAESEGSFTTPYLRLLGSKIILNVQTARTGEVRVELCDRDLQPLPGCSVLDCDPIVGDHVAFTVTWKGNSNVPTLDNSSARIRVQMRSTKIFALSAE
ncbi:MAG: hypothetical protein HUU46_01710 [Candidatus Hydrogenedentes bacterium]|nr:hypothetical protein [Candidatus Hydrogenedentota bacterium]